MGWDRCCEIPNLKSAKNVKIDKKKRTNIETTRCVSMVPSF